MQKLLPEKLDLLANMYSCAVLAEAAVTRAHRAGNCSRLLWVHSDVAGS